MHAVGREQDKPISSAHRLEAVPDGAGMDMVLHVVPFQASATGTLTSPADVERPTARQVLAPGQEIEASVVASAPGMLGELRIAQECPFHTSTSVFWTP